MSVRLGAAAREARLEAGLSLLDIATTAGVSQTTIYFFEQRGGWRRETDRIVEAYARELGITEHTLWQAAIDRDDDEQTAPCPVDDAP